MVKNPRIDSFLKEDNIYCVGNEEYLIINTSLPKKITLRNLSTNNTFSISTHVLINDVTCKYIRNLHKQIIWPIQKQTLNIF